MHDHRCGRLSGAGTCDPSYGVSKLFWGFVDVKPLVAVKVVRNLTFIGIIKKRDAKPRILPLLLA